MEEIKAAPKEGSAKSSDKFSRPAMEVNTKKLTPAQLEEFDSEYVKYKGVDSVFPVKDGLPKVMTLFKNNPVRHELKDEYTREINPKPIPSIRPTSTQGKVALETVHEEFVRATPVVSRCDHPRCLSRLVVVPKPDPEQSKGDIANNYRVTMDSVINQCLKARASTLPLMSDEVKKLSGFKYYFGLDGYSAYHSIPEDEESRRLTAFATHQGIFAFDG